MKTVLEVNCKILTVFVNEKYSYTRCISINVSLKTREQTALFKMPEWRPEDLPPDVPDSPLSRQVDNWLNVGHTKQRASTNTFQSTMCMVVLDCTCCQIILMHSVIVPISSGSSLKLLLTDLLSLFLLERNI
jgi:hypothetical protein